ncbi:MAG: hypothetical protein Unbinned1446contig1005_21 [Prokaryotic dsDNA virus sp.]|nr:MAG: hypothetical protein Unbinned1446contig1005_21 [Prokaryotic dsDNA virus sp.]
MPIALTLKLKNGTKQNVPLPTVEKVFDTYGKAVNNKAKAILEQAGRNATGNLSADIRHEVLIDADGNVVLDYPFRSAPYAMFVEKGVQGAISNYKAPNSPFKFGSGTGPKGTLRPSIRQWILDKPVSQWRDLKTGRFMSYDSMATLISRNVFLHGLEPANFLAPSIELLFKRYKKQIEKAFSIDIDDYVQTYVDSDEINFDVTFNLAG